MKLYEFYLILSYTIIAPHLEYKSAKPQAMLFAALALFMAIVECIIYK